MNHLLPEFWARADILRDYPRQVNFEHLTALRTERWANLRRRHWQELRALYEKLPLRVELENRGDYRVETSKAFVEFGKQGCLTSEEEEVLYTALRKLMPWRKGPFSLCGTEIDAEWRSDFKWQRVAPFLPDLKGKFIADIGCSNGYYMMRALEHQPRGILGIDPSEKFLFAFELFQRFGAFSELQYELMGIEEMNIFDGVFDVVFCFGILYHHRNPLELLRILLDAMRPGADILVETQAIPGEAPVALCPEGRYAKARNVYFIPTASCVASWLKKSGFVDIEICSNVALRVDEQRKTQWMQFESLADYLDPTNPDKTIEGYDAPWRALLKARKPI